jgi:precorrin-8X/cobalt-precorrin-8 methylmutase
MIDYVRAPKAIYERSFAEIARIDALAGLPTDIRPVATRIVHACGMPDILGDLRFSTDVAERTRAALDAGADIYCDVETLRHGVMRHLLPKGCALHCRISAPDVAAHARQHKMTRAGAQVDLWGERLEGQIMAIGNAPTTLFRLMELIDQGQVGRPAVVLAFPVGFVGAAESKDELVRDPRGMAYLTLLGKRGGTAMAQAAVNALAGGLAT